MENDFEILGICIHFFIYFGARAFCMSSDKRSNSVIFAQWGHVIICKILAAEEEVVWHAKSIL